MSLHCKFHKLPKWPQSPLAVLQEKSHYIMPLLLLQEVSLPIPLPKASVVNIWTASTSEHSGSLTLLSSLEMHAQNCQLSKWCWLHSHMKRGGRRGDFSKEQTQHKISFEKEHLCQQLPPSNKSFLNVLHDVISI